MLDHDSNSSLDSYLTIEPKPAQQPACTGEHSKGEETAKQLDRIGDNPLMRVGAEGGIVSEGVAQVVDSLGNPLVIATRNAVALYSQFVSACRSSTGFVALSNTVLTPEGGL